MPGPPSVFEEVGAVLPSLVEGAVEFGPLRQQARRWGIKVWFGGADGKPPRVHYEAQAISLAHAPGARTTAVEVGWHAEHSKEAENEAVLARLVAKERTWRKVVGREPVCGAFLGGRATHWRRISETWADPDLSDPGIPFELAARLTDFITGLEPVLRAGGRRSV